MAFLTMADGSTLETDEYGRAVRVLGPGGEPAADPLAEAFGRYNPPAAPMPAPVPAPEPFIAAPPLPEPEPETAYPRPAPGGLAGIPDVTAPEQEYVQPIGEVAPTAEEQILLEQAAEGVDVAPAAGDIAEQQRGQELWNRATGAVSEARESLDWILGEAKPEHEKVAEEAKAEDVATDIAAGALPSEVTGYTQAEAAALEDAQTGPGRIFRARQSVEEQARVETERARLDQKAAQYAAEHQTKLATNAQAAADAMQVIDEKYIPALDAALEQVQQGAVDPRRLIRDMGAFERIAQAATLFMGGIYQARTGQPNPAMVAIQKEIDRDIAGQQANIAANVQKFAATKSAYATEAGRAAATQDRITVLALAQWEAAKAEITKLKKLTANPDEQARAQELEDAIDIKLAAGKESAAQAKREEIRKERELKIKELDSDSKRQTEAIDRRKKALEIARRGGRGRARGADRPGLPESVYQTLGLKPEEREQLVYLGDPNTLRAEDKQKRWFLAGKEAPKIKSMLTNGENLARESTELQGAVGKGFAFAHSLGSADHAKEIMALITPVVYAYKEAMGIEGILTEADYRQLASAIMGGTGVNEFNTEHLPRLIGKMKNRVQNRVQTKLKNSGFKNWRSYNVFSEYKSSDIAKGEKDPTADIARDVAALDDPGSTLPLAGREKALGRVATAVTSSIDVEGTGPDAMVTFRDLWAGGGKKGVAEMTRMPLSKFRKSGIAHITGRYSRMWQEAKSQAMDESPSREDIVRGVDPDQLRLQVLRRVDASAAQVEAKAKKETEAKTKTAPAQAAWQRALEAAAGLGGTQDPREVELGTIFKGK